jgi:hypothetical protein
MRERIPPPEALVAARAAEAATPAPEFATLADAVRKAQGEDVDAVLLYGSCLRSGDPASGVADLYVIVSRYGRRLEGLLPPTVHYLETAGRSGATLRCKYAVISMADFEAGTSGWFHPYLWARFAQPVRLLFARDERSAEDVARSLASAVITFLSETLPAAGPGPLDAAALWQNALELTYGAELRPEAPGQAHFLAQEQREHAQRLLAAAAPALPDRLRARPDGRWDIEAPARLGRQQARRWRLRRWQGKLLSILRWLKGAATFRGGIDYAAWKIERHTGVRIEVTDRLRRYPLVYGWPLLWRLLRRGTLK